MLKNIKKSIENKGGIVYNKIQERKISANVAVFNILFILLKGSEDNFGHGEKLCKTLKPKK